jgi:hypothetical protein
MFAFAHFLWTRRFSVAGLFKDFSFANPSDIFIKIKILSIVHFFDDIFVILKVMEKVAYNIYDHELARYSFSLSAKVNREIVLLYRLSIIKIR